MEDAEAIRSRPSSPLPGEALAIADTEAQPLISAVLCEIWQQMQESMENMVKMTCEIEQTSVEIMEEIEKCKESVEVSSKLLEEEKDNLQKAALALLQIFNGSEAI